MVGALLTLLLAALDQTIVGTAMPKIVSELNGLQDLSWVFTAYLLTSTIGIPIIGKLSDLYGRKIFFIGGILIFLMGSVLSGLSQNMAELIGFRALQGIGAGAIMSNSFAAIGDLFPPAQRARWQGLFGGVFGIASVVGPLLGGFLTDNVSWRWNFFINVPIGLIALGFIGFLMPNIIHRRESERSIDFAGAAALTACLVPLLLGLVWGGNQYPWDSWQEVSLLGFSGIALLGFLYIESVAREPIVRLGYFKSNIFTVSSIITFLTGFGLFGAVQYIPLFAQDVTGISATNSGLIITPMTVGIVVAALAAGQVISRTGRYKILAITGLAVTVGSLFLLSRIDSTTSYTTLSLDMIVMGVGLGLNFPIYTLIVQNAFSHRELGAVTASNQLFRSLGGTVGVAVMGSVLNNVLSASLGDLSRDKFVQSASQLNSNFNLQNLDINSLQSFLTRDVQSQIHSRLAKLPQPMQAQVINSFNEFIIKVKEALASGIAEVFFVVTFIMVLALIVSFFLKEVPIRNTHDVPIGDELSTGREQTTAA
jgi:EmrB/QacA subfamily drug resistance transporter